MTDPPTHSPSPPGLEQEGLPVMPFLVIAGVVAAIAIVFSILVTTGSPAVPTAQRVAPLMPPQGGVLGESQEGGTDSDGRDGKGRDKDDKKKNDKDKKKGDREGQDEDRESENDGGSREVVLVVDRSRGPRGAIDMPDDLADVPPLLPPVGSDGSPPEGPGANPPAGVPGPIASADGAEGGDDDSDADDDSNGGGGGGGGSGDGDGGSGERNGYWTVVLKPTTVEAVRLAARDAGLEITDLVRAEDVRGIEDGRLIVYAGRLDTKDDAELLRDVCAALDAESDALDFSKLRVAFVPTDSSHTNSAGDAGRSAGGDDAPSRDEVGGAVGDVKAKIDDVPGEVEEDANLLR